MTHSSQTRHLLSWENGKGTQEPAGCSNPEAHEAHMAVNGECPWCGSLDLTAIDDDLIICEAHGNPDCGLCG